MRYYFFRHCLTILLMLCAPLAMAQTVYEYTGNNYDFFEAPYTANSQITGGFTVANILPDNSTTDLSGTLQEFSFTDGQATRDQSNTTICTFSITTNAVGNIVDWEIFLREDDPGAGGFQHNLETRSAVSQGVVFDQSGFASTTGTTGCGGIAQSPFGSSSIPPAAGAWTAFQIDTPPMGVPAISQIGMVLMLLLISAAGITYAYRRIR